MNMEAAEKTLVEANVTPVGQAWGVEGEMRVFYGREYPVLLYIWPEGVRIQVAVKTFERNEMSERCIFYTEPKELNVKEIMRSELSFLREKQVISLTERELEEVVRLAGWGLAGNMWIKAGGNAVRVEGVRGCRSVPVFLLNEWKKREEGQAPSTPFWVFILLLPLLLILWLARR